ncbi:MAG: winged helix-turn-helix transcriptional regulator [Acidimicrobiia bacterium]|nr:winged helix-turn-helix transcriptional regulator [Acidimicrobiia bacterium]
MSALPSAPADADSLFHALADPTRRDIVTRAMHGEHSVSALAGHYPMSFAAVQKHVAVLERATLVTKERRGREHLVRTNIDAVRAVAQVLDDYETVWRDRMDRFADVLASRQEGERS